MEQDISIFRQKSQILLIYNKASEKCQKHISFWHFSIDKILNKIYNIIKSKKIGGKYGRGK